MTRRNEQASNPEAFRPNYHDCPTRKSTAPIPHSESPKLMPQPDQSLTTEASTPATPVLLGHVIKAAIDTLS